jgi:cysteine desulfurase
MRIYFDYNATTPLAPEVIDAIARSTRDVFGNASSVHAFGQDARAAVDRARREIATPVLQAWRANVSAVVLSNS